ncbi:hypothetical protein [Streptomyces pactum]|uniref:DUF2238 domain-containing protein n=1 Tax=Streptomyces pactum TaxID=68249 RepID=A0A1S6J235_9ACTN|nr:hypothetical protein [Streptomyces pactum]AQS65810.1 hypothetical protein B1H29_01625 [Streptomyces pactum]
MTWLAVMVLACSAVVVGALGEGFAALRFLSGVVLLVVVTRLRVPPPFEAVFSVVVTVAFWCDVGSWYRRAPELDTVVHFLLTGTGSVVVFLALLRGAGPALGQAAANIPRWTLTVLVGMAGTSAATLWELYEWVAEQATPGTMRVGYGDTVADLAVGVAGSLLAGALFAGTSRAALTPTSSATRRKP